jgi:hypothetical protein
MSVAMLTNLEKLLEQKKQGNVDQQIAHETEKQEWLERLNALYSQIGKWLGPLKEKRYLEIVPKQVVIEEELFGKYDTLGLIIQFYNGTSIELIPVGWFVSEARGRVDMNLRDRVLKIVGRADGSGWDIAEPVGLRHERKPFDQENFEALLEGFVSRF